MTTADELLMTLGEQAQSLGWTLVYVEREGETGIGLVFKQNTSPYGVSSSRERAKSRVAVLSDLMGEQARRTVEAHRESQRILTPESGGFDDDRDL